MALDRNLILNALGADSLFSSSLITLEETDSTNTRLKALAEAGAPEGTVVIARRQTQGRGTHGRAFHSPEGGLYVSVLLRPRTTLADLFPLTGWAACAVRRGIEAASGAPVEIKWLNDVYLHGRKLCGILTELGGLGENTAGYVVLGAGINAAQTAEDFSAAGLEQTAISLSMAGYPTSLERLCACVLQELEQMYRAFPHQRDAYLSDYRAHCLTLGRQVRVEGGRLRFGAAVGIGDDFSLTVQERSGEVFSVSSGTVSLL